jgi:hypothetical protein
MKFPLRGAERQMIVDAARMRPEFAAFKAIPATLNEAAFARPALLDFCLRLSLEQAFLERANVPPGLAALAAARAAAQVIQAELETLAPEDRAALPPWVAAMAGDIPPANAVLAGVAPATGAEIEKIRAIWSLLGTTESLMETGGDIRLETDPRSALNGYGCSHRPRPWAITFASSTASSSSERGYAAADRTRLRTTAALLTGEKRQAVAKSLGAVRRGIARSYGLDKPAVACQWRRAATISPSTPPSARMSLLKPPSPVSGPIPRSPIFSSATPPEIRARRRRWRQKSPKRSRMALRRGKESSCMCWTFQKPASSPRPRIFSANCALITAQNSTSW